MATVVLGSPAKFVAMVKLPLLCCKEIKNEPVHGVKI
jgi:hypothetical protein